MKKINVIITVVLALLSAFFLWLWYYLGLNRVDEPLDLILSVVWWAVIVVGIVCIVKMEKTRQEKVRTLYVADGALFNSETGICSLLAESSTIDTMEAILRGLKYNFDKADLPDRDQMTFEYVVRSTKFDSKDDQSQEEDSTWEGEVVTVASGEVRPFASKEELAALLA